MVQKFIRRSLLCHTYWVLSRIAIAFHCSPLQKLTECAVLDYAYRHKFWNALCSINSYVQGSKPISRVVRVQGSPPLSVQIYALATHTPHPSALHVIRAPHRQYTGQVSCTDLLLGQGSWRCSLLPPETLSTTRVRSPSSDSFGNLPRSIT
jgi:hypothetical protein